MAIDPQGQLKHTYIFLGPSLSQKEAQKILPANYLGPVAQGDVVGLLWKNPKNIIIIDGYFNRVPAVWHKEILLAMERGVRVYGAASMGALRAAELYQFGMIGHGRIFEWYRDGVVTGDADVALIHGAAAEGYKNLSLPLVNVRATVQAALERGLITEEGAGGFLAAAAAIYYPERNWETCLAAGKSSGVEISPEFAGFCRGGGVDQKREDARAILQLVAQKIAHPTPPPPPATAIANTTFLYDLLGNDLSLLPGGGQVTPRLLREYGRLSGHFAEVELAAQMEMLADCVARLLHWDVSPEEISAEAGRFWQERNIHSVFAIRNWLEENKCSSPHLEAILQRRVWLRKLQQTTQMPLSYYYQDVLRQRGEFAASVERVARLEERWQVQKGFINPEELSDEIWEKILNSARRAVNDTDGQLPLEKIAALLGYKGVPELVRQLLKEK